MAGDSFSVRTNCGYRHKIFFDIPARSQQFQARVRHYDSACIWIENYGNGIKGYLLLSKEER